jgi:hypothetical protein
LPDPSPIQNDLKKEMLFIAVFNVALEDATRQVLVYQMGLKLNGAHKLLVYVHDENLLGNATTQHNNTKSVTDISNEVDLEDNRGVFNFSSWGKVGLSPLGTAATTGLLYQPQTIDDECGAVGGMRIGRRNRSTRRKPAPVPLSPPQIP